MTAHERELIPETIIEQARAVNLAALIGKHVKLTRKGKAWWGCCPFHKDKSPSFKVENERRNYHCFGCGARGDSIAWLRAIEHLSFADAVRRLMGASSIYEPPRTIRQPRRSEIVDQSPFIDHGGNDAGKTNEDERQTAKARALWRRRKGAKKSPVETYLQARGYAGPIPATIGYLPPGKSEHHPAMISAFGMAAEPEPGTLIIREQDISGIHLTLLRPDGSGKAGTEKDKIMLGRCKGVPIVLAAPNDGLGLVVCEGIEDALSIHHSTGLGSWAAGSAGFMSALADAVPNYIDCVTICAHDDEPGRKGAGDLVNGLRARGINAIVLLPEMPESTA